MSNEAEFEIEIQDIQCRCVVEHYLPELAGDIECVPSEEEFEYRLETLEGDDLSDLQNRLTGDDMQAIFDAYINEVKS